MIDIGVLPTMPAVLARAVERYPDNELVVVAGQRCTFARAEQESRLLAKRLLAAGVGKGTRVGICMTSGVDWVVSWLALGRVGAISLLYSSAYRPAELGRALRIGDAQLLLAPATLFGRDRHPYLEEAIPGLGDATPAFRLPSHPYLRGIWMVGGADRPWATDVAGLSDNIDDELLAAVESEVAPADILTVIFTSGTQADPKGVMHTHGTVFRKMAPESRAGLGPSYGGRAFCAMPFFWIGGIQALGGALLSGATILGQEKFDAGDGLDIIERERATSTVTWSTTGQALRNHPTYAQRDLSSLAPTFPSTWASPRPSSKGDLSTGLGMTETMGPHSPVDEVEVRIADPVTGETLPEGDEGEFCVRGYIVMAGLYKKEREEVFDADGWYHTGDGGYLEAGCAYMRSRLGDMIKSHGANVAPLEVEHVLESFPEVRHAFVFGIPDEERGEAVAAVLVPAEGTTIDAADATARANTLLSSYKVPSHVLVVENDDVPWMASGKPNRRELRERLITTARPGEGSPLPGT